MNKFWDQIGKKWITLQSRASSNYIGMIALGVIDGIVYLVRDYHKHEALASFQKLLSDSKN